jgi:maltose-binding protein MalE
MWGTLYSAIVFKAADPAKQRAALQAALAILADDSQLAHATSDAGMPVTKTAADSAAYKQLVAQDPPTKATADMFPYCGVDPTIPSQGEMRQIMDENMLKIYNQQMDIKNALLDAERRVQALHDADLAQSKK